MKKIALTIVCAVAMTGAAFAQQNINWNVISPAAMTARTNSLLYSPLFGGGSAVGGSSGVEATAASGNAYDWALLYMGPTSGVGSYNGSQLLGGSAPSNSLSALLNGGWDDSGLHATNSAAGFLSPMSPSTADGVPWAAGTTNYIIMVGWSANLGNNWLTVSNELANWAVDGIANAYFGVSTAGYLTPSVSNPGAAPFASGASAFGLPINSLNTTMYLLPVPEPTTIALAGLGGLSLLLFRRRKV